MSPVQVNDSDSGLCGLCLWAVCDACVLGMWEMVNQVRYLISSHHSLVLRPPEYLNWIISHDANTKLKYFRVFLIHILSHV